MSRLPAVLLVTLALAASAACAGDDAALVGIEPGDRVLCFDISDPGSPVLVGRAKTGDRPEGLIAIADSDSIIVITGDEGKERSGSITISRVELKD